MLPDPAQTPVPRPAGGIDPQLPSRGPLRRGELCPRCGVGTLDYNGLIDLECPACGYTEGPGGGCT